MAEWSKDQIIARIRGEAQKQGVDPDLALAVAMQESELWPNAKGDNGKSLGLFQLQPAAAIDVGVNPQWRHEPGVNIYGGVKFLAQKLQQSKGNVEEALRRYNGGGDPNYVQNVLRFFKPGVAEAAERPQAGTYTDADVQQALKALQAPQESPGGTYTDADVQSALKALQQPAQATTPPAQPRTPAASQSAPTGTQAPPEPSPDPSSTPGMRFQALPSITQLDLADRMQKTKLFESLTPAMQEEFLRSEEPAPGGLAVGGGPVAQTRPVTDRAALLAVGGGTGGTWREGDPLPPEARRPPTPAEAPVEESLTAPSTMIPLVMGTGIPFLTTAAPGMAAAGRLLPQAGPLITRGARAAAEGLSSTLGWTAGRTAETGQVPSPGEIATEAALNVAVGGAIELPGAAANMLRRSKAGKAIMAADEATTSARQAWEQEVAAAKAASQAGRTEAYQAAERRALDAQARYQTRVQQRDATIAANQQEYQDALAAHRAEVQTEQSRRYGQARAETIDETATTQARQQQYQHAVTGQQQAIAQAQAVPGRYTPQTPSWVLYEKFGDAAKDAVVDLTPAKAALADVRASRGVLPDGSMRPLPSAVESIASNLEKATGETSIKTIREELRRLGPLTRSGDSNVRGAAKQLYGIYADVLEASPVANDLLRNANATFRKEMALQDVQEWLRPGHGVVRVDNQGRQTINVGALLTRLEKQVGDDALFRGSFAPDELQALRQDLGRLAGTPTMPRGGMPQAVRPELLPGAAPNVPASMQHRPEPGAVPREVARPRPEQLPGGGGPGRRTPETPAAPAPVTPREQLGPRPKALGPRAGEWGAILSTLQALGVPTAPLAVAAGVYVTQKQGRWLLAHAMLSERGQRVLQAAMDTKGTLHPRAYGALVATLSPAEKKAYEREAGAKR